MNEYIFLKEDYLSLVESIKNLEREYDACGKRTMEGTNVGDWHDNFAHEEAMRQLRIISTRLVELNEIASRARVLDESEIASQKGVVGLGCKITIVNEDDEEKCYYIGSHAIFRKAKYADGKWLIVSYSSPLISQLMGKQEGEEVIVNVNGAESSVVIEEVILPSPVASHLS